jgi:hypothetical protein
LFSKVHSVQQAFAEGETLPAFDVQCPLLTLPLIFRNDLNNIPATVPYLKADRKKSGAWKQRLSGEPAGRRVGLVWAGSATHKRDRTRSLSPAIFAPLASVAGNVFFSLQKGEPAKQPFPSELQVRDFTQELNDFSDTAALVDNLDLVITVDTAVAHLAGAMGKPVWVLLAHASDWRWLRERTDSPWYPSMRLFRQTKPGEWGGSIEEVGGALRKFGGK